jgi:hypothetical protein
MHHSDPDDQLAPGKESNHACYQCHASYHDNLAAHTHHAADSSGSQCYNCHMPHTTYGLFKAIRSHQITSPNAATALKTGRPAACNMCHLDQTLQWTTDKLHDWYGQPLVELDDDQRSLSVVALNLVQGDTFKRAMFSWIAGWRPALECVRATAATASADPDANGERPGNDAQRATATHWLVPLLAPLLHHEESSVVRLMAWRSLSKIDERYGVDYDFVGSEAQRAESAQRIMELWRQIPAPQRAMGDRLLLLPDGEPDREWTDRLFENRDNRVLRVSE